jgi:hypothetical protein
MRLLCAVVCIFAFAGSGLAQVSRFSFGVKGGFILSDSVSYPGKEPDRYTVGPTIEVSFRKHFAIEADALYKRLERPSGVVMYSVPPGVGPVGVLTQYAANNATDPASWEFPVLGKYYFGYQSRNLRIFAGAGFSLERSTATTFVILSKVVSPGAGPQAVGERRSQTCPGATFSTGFTWKKGRVKLTPEFRYTRWGELPYQPGINRSS